jgi:hypothetical protein
VGRWPTVVRFFQLLRSELGSSRMYGLTRALTPEPAPGAALRAGSLQAVDFPQVLQYLFALFPQPPAVNAAEVRQSGHSVSLVSCLAPSCWGSTRMSGM